MNSNPGAIAGARANGYVAAAGATTSAFDALAGGYDAGFTHTAVGRALRDVVWGRLAEAFGSSGRVLELGCGTGEDAIYLAQRGVRVVATDASAEMIGVARAKAQRAGCSSRIEFVCLPMEQLATALRGERFDGVFSNFGAVNCVPDLPSLAAGLGALLAPRAPLLWVAMGRYVPWEWAWYGMRGDWRKAVRRLRRGGAHWRGLTVTYPTPRRLAAQLHPHFDVYRTTALGFALPPSYAAAWLERFPRVFANLETLEALARGSSVLASLSDHYVIEGTRACS